MEPIRTNTVAAPPFSVGSVLNRTFTTLKKNPGVFLGLTVVMAVPSAIVGFTLPPSPNNTLAVRFVEIILSLIVQGATAYAVYQALTGGAASFTEAVSRGMSRIGVLFAAAILMSLGVVLGLALLIIPGIILYCLWSVTIPVCAVEKLGPLKAMKRSGELTKGYRLRIFGLILIMFGIALAVGFLAGLVIILVLNNLVAAIVIRSIMFIIPQAFSNVMISIIYYDLRVAKEGVSLNKLVNVFD